MRGRVAAARRDDDTEGRINGLLRTSLIVGLIGLAATVAGALLLSGVQQGFRSYLIGFLFWVGLSLGSLGLMLLHNLAGGGWGMLIRRILEAGARTIPFMALLFIPIALGMGYIYDAWVNMPADDALLQWKKPYLNVPFFLGRTALYFVIWTVVAYLFSNRSRRHDEDPSRPVGSRTSSGLAMVAIAAAATFALFDWVMTLEPHWFSAIFSASIVSGMMLSTFAFSILVTRWLARSAPMSRIFTPQLLSDVGSLMMAFTLIWAYLNFSQLIIQYAANLPEETPYYLKRAGGGWQFISNGLILLHFALPFVLLISNKLRRTPRLLAGVAVLLLLSNALYYLWLVRPAFDHGVTSQLSFHWMDISSLIGVGGLWLALFAWQLRQKPVVPALAVAQLAAREHESISAVPITGENRSSPRQA